MRKIEFQIFDESLKNLLDKYSPEEIKIGATIEKMIENSSSNEIVIPVLGMQGMGKSTLINSILKENILPNAADETTCVPVEVRFGEDEHAEVFFDGKSETKTVFTREELNEFVDNNFNRGNEKQVAKIVLFRNRDILKNGLVIVDLPGVGSMTKANENTTKHYIENLCTAVFVIPTVPTIRKLEAMFIKGVWSQFTNAIFVQNDWGETEKEIADAVEYNTIKLSQIAKELNNSFDEKIIVVNAYNAIKGALDKDENLVTSSNINSLITKINELSQNWQGAKETALKKRLALSILSSKKIIQKQIDESKKSKEEIVKQREIDYRNFEEGTKHISDKVDEVKRLLKNNGDELYSLTKTKASECTGHIRSKVYKLIDDGVVDGEQLTQGFKDIQEDETSVFFEEIFTSFLDLKFKLETEMEELSEIILEENDLHFDSNEFYNGDKFKFEKSFEVAFGIAGGIGAIFGAEAAAGAIVSSLGLGAALTGPIGIAVGLGIVLVAGIIGHFAKKGVQNARGNEAKKQIAPYIDEIEDTLRKKITQKLDDFVSQTKKLLNSIVDERKSQEEKMYSKIHEEVDSSDIKELEKDMLLLESKEKEMKNV